MESYFLIGPENILIVFLAVFVRLFFSIKKKAEDLTVPFNLKGYFNSRKIIRWIGHLFTAVTLALVLPEIFLTYLGPKYLPEVTNWSFIGDFIIGFSGYDLIKFAEKATRPMVEKITGKKFE